MAKFAAPLGEFRFGLEKEAIANTLESLAAGIRSESILPQAVSLSNKAVGDDFEYATLKLTYAERK